MAALPPPEGLTEEDYDSIHAAVVETVRGRWFLAEYARRSRIDEVQDMLAAIGRLESVVTSQRVLPQGEASPHLRLLTQRASEIAGRLAIIAEDLRDSGADAYICDDLETQVRALSALPRGPSSDPVPAVAPERLPIPEPRPSLEPPPRLLQDSCSELPIASSLDDAYPVPDSVPPMPRSAPLEFPESGEDPRLAALAVIDSLSLTEKLALFS